MELRIRVVLLAAIAANVWHAYAAGMPAASPRLIDLSESLSVWAIDHRVGVLLSDRTLTITDAAGWVRTTETRLGDFELTFEAAARTPNAIPVLVLFGAAQSHSRITGLALPLLGEHVSVNPELPLMAINDSGVMRAKNAEGEWQQYVVRRHGTMVTVVLNGQMIAQQPVAYVLDGWIGFQTRTGVVAVRNVRVLTSSGEERDGAGQPVDEYPGAVRPGKDVLLPKVMREVRPQYTGEAMKAHVEGAVSLECLVRIDGTVGDVKIVRSLDPLYGLDQEAVKAARQWRFQPGTRLGQHVPVVVTIELTFTLRK